MGAMLLYLTVMVSFIFGVFLLIMWYGFFLKKKNIKRIKNRNTLLFEKETLKLLKKRSRLLKLTKWGTIVLLFFIIFSLLTLIFFDPKISTEVVKEIGGGLGNAKILKINL